MSSTNKFRVYWLNLWPLFTCQESFDASKSDESGGSGELGGSSESDDSGKSGNFGDSGRKGSPSSLAVKFLGYKWKTEWGRFKEKLSEKQHTIYTKRVIVHNIKKGKKINVCKKCFAGGL